MPTCLAKLPASSPVGLLDHNYFDIRVGTVSSRESNSSHTGVVSDPAFQDKYLMSSCSRFLVGFDLFGGSGLEVA